LEKWPKQLPNQKKAKKSTSKLNLKVQNIYIKPLLKHSNVYNAPCFETAHLGKYVKNAFEKVAQIVPFFGPHTTQKGTWVLKT
jgi:hypothetical protein